MSLRGFTSWAAGLSTLAALGCMGARTTLDQEDFLGTGETAGTDGKSKGGSSAGGRGGQSSGGEAGIATGGGVQGGTTGVAGAAGIGGVAGGVGGGGVGGVAGAGGKGGGSGRRIEAACEQFCGPYSMACPADAGTPENCTWNCVDQFGGGPRECRDTTLEALDCLNIYFNPDLGCDQALSGALQACFEIVQQAQSCVDGGEPPPPPPPSCPGSFYTGTVDCQATLMCPEAYYYAYCSAIGGGQIACDCTDDFGGATSFVSDVPIDAACGYALELCGYPY
ncbi:MAG TPA: hypothetical protein VM686_06790 [Polyangiaceae bacterium]|nr:hypothetical protein [Polyangiaceae bacterium]